MSAAFKDPKRRRGLPRDRLGPRLRQSLAWGGRGAPLVCAGGDASGRDGRDGPRDRRRASHGRPTQGKWSVESG